MADLTCVACGRKMKRHEGYSHDLGHLCHPSDANLRDCYHRWTVYGDPGHALSRCLHPQGCGCEGY